MSLFWLWQLVWIESIKDFFKEKFEFDIDENKFFKAIELFIDWKWFAWLHVLAKWTEVLNEWEENNSFYKKVAEEINKTKYAKNLDWWMKWKAIKSVWSEKTKELTSWLDYIIRSTKNLLPFADNEEKKQVDALVWFIKKKKEEMKLKIKKNDTVDMTLKQIMWEDPSSSQPQEKQDWSSQENMSWDTNEESEQRWDRTLFARVSQFSAKAKYYDGLYDKYLKYKWLDVWWKRLQKMRKIYEVGQFTKQEKWYLYEMIKLEEKWGIQKIFSDLQNETDPKKAKLLKKEIEGYIKNYEKFESFFSIYVRNMRSKPSFLDENIDSYKKFEVLKAKEVDLWEEIHNISKAYDEKILNLRKTETDTKLLEKKEAEAKKRFNDELYWKNWKVTELRNVQKSMLEELSIISTGDSLKSREFVNKNIWRFKTKVLPWWKVWLALLWLTVWSVALEWIKQEDFNKELMLAWWEAVWSFVPFVNVWLDFRQILSWEDLAGRKLSWIERWAMAPTFLVLDTVWSIATATWIWAVAWVPILIWSNALKWAKWAKMLKTAKEVEQVAKNTHTSKWIVEQQKLMEKLRKQWLHIIWSAQDVSRIPWDIIFKYQEWMKLAYNSWLLKAASPLMSVSKIWIYGWLWYSVITGIWETWNLILEKTNPILEFLKELV